MTARAPDRRRGPGAAADGGVARAACVRLRGLAGQVRQVAAVGVDRQHEGPVRGVAHDRDRRRVDDDPLEQRRGACPSASARIALIDVAVADRHPHRVGTVLGLDAGVAASYGGDGAGRHRRHRLAARERRRRRMRLHGPPERLLRQRLELAPGPLAVVALGEPALGRRPRPAWPARRSPARSRGSAPAGWSRRAASGSPASRSAAARACCAPGVVEPDARESARRARRGVGGGAAVPHQDDRGHAARVRGCRDACVAPQPSDCRDRRQRRLPRRRTGRPSTATRTTSPESGPRRTRARRLRVGRAARARPARARAGRRRSSGCTRWRSRTPSTRTSGPRSSATTTSSSSSSRPSGTSTRTTPSRPARSASSSAHDFVITVRHGAGAS